MTSTLRSLLLCAGLLAGASSAPATAHAQAAAARRETPLARSLHGPARDAYDAAGALMQHGDFLGAEAKYQEAYDLAKDPRLLFNMAACEKSRHGYARMGALLQRFKQEMGASISADDRAAVDEALGALPRFVGTVTVNVNVPGATVSVDGENVGTAPLGSPATLDPGRHMVVVQKEGYEKSERPIDISAGMPSSLAVTLVVNVAAPSGAPPLAAGEAPAPEAPPATEATGHRCGPLVYAGFGLAGAGLVAGIVTGVLAIGKRRPSAASATARVARRASTAI